MVVIRKAYSEIFCVRSATFVKCCHIEQLFECLALHSFVLDFHIYAMLLKHYDFMKTFEYSFQF